MKLISWNTNGLRATVKQGNFDGLFKYGADIIAMQETKSEPEQLTSDVRNVVGYESYFDWSKVKKGYSGVCIYTKESPSKVGGLGIKKFDDEGRTLVAEYDDFYFITCYFPNGGGGPDRLKYKLEFYDAFLSYIEKLKKKKPVIFCGDVNTAHNEIDLARPKENEENTGFLPIERAWMDKLVAKGWVDAYRHLNPTKKDVYTYWDQKTRARDRNVGWRIDYFFVSKGLEKKIKDFKTISDYYGSDHCPILLEINI
jgi:exodeoxyribonuclease-3